MIDFDAVADALVSTFDGVTPPSGEAAITTATADLPETIVQERTLLVFPPESPQWTDGPSLRHTLAIFPVRFYLWLVRDSKRNTRLMRKWSTALYSALDTNAHLGLEDYVAVATLASGPSIGKVNYNGGSEQYWAVEFTVGVRLWEGVTASG